MPLEFKVGDRVQVIASIERPELIGARGPITGVDATSVAVSGDEHYIGVMLLRDLNLVTDEDEGEGATYTVEEFMGARDIFYGDEMYAIKVILKGLKAGA